MGLHILWKAKPWGPKIICFLKSNGAQKQAFSIASGFKQSQNATTPEYVQFPTEPRMVTGGVLLRRRWSEASFPWKTNL